ncbi:MAG: hypothetical protein BJ554DRAFT_1464 [Olpidium bornovanus]|uniref:Uncharacterized protein n=1 Tax=Olpidium bornovanus TaxID=278681 RepID=A0A8H8DH69_9FUNG|nr:MAG: hypothetical protein BJ554DRAFT_1464 [Olpidium bornovanus]
MKLDPVDQRSVIGRVVELVADTDVPRMLTEAPHKLVVNILVHEYPGSRAAALPVIEEDAHGRRSDRPVEIRIRKHDGRAFPAKL